MRMILINLFILSFILSCSSINLNDRHPDNIASSDCRKLMNEMIQVEANEEVDLSEIQNFRNVLNAQYESISESVKDLELKPDLPFNTEAKLVLDPNEGFLAKVLLIRKAKKTIDLTYFIFSNDDTSKTILHELRMAVKRGVKVRLMIDSMGSLKKAPFYNDIKALTALQGKPILDSLGNATGETAAMEAVLFNPLFNVTASVQNWFKRIYNILASDENKLPIANFSFNRRSHDKILLIDSYSPEDSMVMIGGRNIADHYYNIDKNDTHKIVDAEVIIKGVSNIKDGKIENIIEEHYNKIYFYLANRNFTDFLFKTNRKIVRREFKSMRESAQHLIGENGNFTNKLSEMDRNNYLNSNFENSLVSVVSEIQNLTRRKVFLRPKDHHVIKNVNSLMSKLNEHIATAHQSIDLVTPYFWLPDEEITFLMEWLKKDPTRTVRIITNSIVTNNHITSQALIDNVFDKKIYKIIKDTPLEKQFLLYSYGKLDHEVFGGTENYGLLHAKVFVVDGKKIMISTANLDPISRNLNSEFGITMESLEDQSINTQNINNFVNLLVSKSTLWGSSESNELRSHPAIKTKILLEKFVTKIIYTLNLEPIL